MAKPAAKSNRQQSRSPLLRCAFDEVVPLLEAGLASQADVTKALFQSLFLAFAEARGSSIQSRTAFKKIRGANSPLACDIPLKLAREAHAMLRPCVSDATPVRELGTIYEALLIRHGRQKSSGSFYTPDHIVAEMVQKSLAPSPQFARIIDPAMGCGHFLVAAANFLARGESKKRAIERCIYGTDLDPIAAEITRLSLWLEAPDVDFKILDAHLLVGDGLSDAPEASFDAVLCNPPYAGHKKDVDAARLRRDFEVCRRHANLAAAFCERCIRLLKPAGRYGLIVPKAIQYVESWSPTRKLLSLENRLEHLIDASESFDRVLLEQTICIGARAPATTHYRAEVRVPLKLTRELDVLPAKLAPQSMRLLKRIATLGPRLSDISKTTQALGLQAHVTNGQTNPRNALNIFRGRHIEPLRINESREWLAHEHHGFSKKVRDMLVPKVVSQNIVAHLTRPRPRIWIISAPDPAGVLCLNTISTTILHDDRFTIEYISTILNSSLASWFYYEFVYCRAVRTMHFDGYYAGKLPIALPSACELKACKKLCENPPTQGLQKAIDDIVFGAYALTPSEREFVSSTKS